MGRVRGLSPGITSNARHKAGSTIKGCVEWPKLLPLCWTLAALRRTNSRFMAYILPVLLEKPRQNLEKIAIRGICG